MPWRCSQSSARLCNDNNKLLHKAKAMASNNKKSTAQRKCFVVDFRQNIFICSWLNLSLWCDCVGRVFCSLFPLFNYNSAIISFHVYIFILNLQHRHFIIYTYNNNNNKSKDRLFHFANRWKLTFSQCDAKTSIKLDCVRPFGRIILEALLKLLDSLDWI